MSKRSGLISLLKFFFFFTLFSNGQTSEAETRLLHYLFDQQNYNPLVRPTAFANETIVVSFGLLLVQLIDVYEREQTMKTNTWLHLKWYDYQLRWNPSQYDGIEKVNVPCDLIWTPDIVLFNNAGKMKQKTRHYGNYEVSFKSKVIVTYTGVIYWIPPAIYVSSCRIDVHYFPFDHQECELRFGSLTYNAHELTFAQYTDEIDRKDDLISEGTDEMRTDDYVESVSWNIINMPGKIVRRFSNTSNQMIDFIEVVFIIQISRKALYYTVSLIVPIGMISILICTVFYLPTAGGEKLTLCTSLLFALNLFQLLVTQILPATSVVVPLISKYLLFTFTLNILLIVNTTIVTNFYYRNTIHNEMSDSFRTLMFDVLPSMLKLKPRQESIQNNPELCYQSRKSSKYMELEQALNDIRYIALHLDNESNRNDWKYVAIVVDRFQFLVFTSINFIGSIALLLQVPDLSHSTNEVFARFSNPNVSTD